MSLSMAVSITLGTYIVYILKQYLFSYLPYQNSLADKYKCLEKEFIYYNDYPTISRY